VPKGHPLRHALSSWSATLPPHRVIGHSETHEVHTHSEDSYVGRSFFSSRASRSSLRLDKLLGRSGFSSEWTASQCPDSIWRLETLERIEVAYIRLDDRRVNFVSRIKLHTWSPLTVFVRSHFWVRTFAIRPVSNWVGVEFLSTWIFLSVTFTFSQPFGNSWVVSCC
jgi:hypothetical protein